VTAVLHHLAPRATVVGIDHIAGLTQMSRTNLVRDGLAADSVDARLHIVTRDGRRGDVIEPLLRPG
jgi:protein-L-isoaspartate(D-aspartate) O-methyltransferase